MAFKQKCICLIAICFISYYNSLDGDFVFDDFVAIVKNKDITSTSQLTLTSLKEIFKHDFWGSNITDSTSHKSYRPLTILMFQIEYHFFGGLNSLLMKLNNLIIHCVNSILVLKLFKKLISAPECSFIGAVLFAIHPIHCEAVCGIVGRAELMFAFFYLITLIMYSDSKFGIKSNLLLLPNFTVIICISFIALLFKENAICILPTCIAFDITVRTNLFQKFESRFRIRKSILKRCIVLAVITVAFIIIRLSVQNFEKPNFKQMDNPIGFCDDPIKRILSQNYLYALNAWIVLCPYWLSFDWALGCVELIDSLLDIRIFSIIVFWTIVYCLLLKSSRIVLLATILTIVPFLPASGILKVGFVIAERILYVPSIGFCLLISIGFGYVTERFHKIKQFFYIFLILFLIIFILRTQQRGGEWRTGEKLFASALNVCPNNAKVHYNIAREATDYGDKKKAFEHYHKAIKLYPQYEAALMNLGNLYRDVGDLDTAEVYLRKSIEALEDFPAAWMNLGIVLAAKKKFEEAEESYQKALSYQKNYSSCLYNFGNLYLEMNNLSLAMKYWHESISLNPKQSKAWANILTFLDNRGLYEDVLRISEHALKYLPNDVSVLFVRASVLGKLKKYEESEQLFLKVIKINPNNSLYQSNLGVLYHRWGKKDSAIEHYKIALQINPNNKSTRDNLQKLLHSE